MEGKSKDQEVVDAVKDNYNASADAYSQWSQTNHLMQNLNYYSTFNEMEKEGIQGKTFMEFGCGPCPIGQILAKKGAKKIYGLDISSEMIESSKKNLTEIGLIDQFELVCGDICDDSFQLPEKVDCVVMSYVLTAFVNNYEMLAKILSQIKKCVKDDGYVLIAEFWWMEHGGHDFWGGMYTKAKGDAPPKDFEPFDFFFETAPENPIDIYNIPNHLMFRAGYEAGFDRIEYQPQYCDPALKDDPIIRRYIDECDPTDYLMKFKFAKK